MLMMYSDCELSLKIQLPMHLNQTHFSQQTCGACYLDRALESIYFSCSFQAFRNVKPSYLSFSGEGEGSDGVDFG